MFAYELCLSLVKLVAKTRIGKLELLDGSIDPNAPQRPRGGQGRQRDRDKSREGRHRGGAKHRGKRGRGKRR